MLTKTVEGTFGPKQVTQEEFVRRWTNIVSEVGYICETSADYRALEAMQSTIKALAERKWETIK